jgi:peptidoglycan DL-endopeptidase CwlO
MLKALMFYHRMKQKNKKQNNSIRARFVTAPALTVLALVVIAGITVPIVRADQFDEQIKVLQQQNAAAQGSLNDLAAQATSFQDTISKLQAQISALQQLINDNLAEQARLQGQIDEGQKELARQKALLATDIKTMYVDGSPTTIEMLASSNNLSDFVDKEEYRTAVQKKIQVTLQKIQDLQRKLEQEKAKIDQLLTDQKNQQASLGAASAEQARLLAFNEGQQAAYNAQIASNRGKIADLRKQQAILNSKYNIGSLKGDPNNGGYPSIWANAPQDSVIDYWGMYNRECVSWTAFKVHQDYVAGKNNIDMPYWGGVGNANQWDDNARAAGIPVDSNPTVGSIAVSNAGFYGHVMYVEAVSTINGQQAIYVSQYNASFDGQYSESWKYTTGLVFIHF